MGINKVKLESFTIEINDDNMLEEIAYTGGDKELLFSKMEFTKEISTQLLSELIGSRLASEKIILDLYNELESKGEEVETLLEKLSEQDKFIEDNRKKLEA